MPNAVPSATVVKTPLFRPSFWSIAIFVLVASVASHIAASSFSGALSYWRRRAIDPLLALVLLSGGTIGTALGVWTFTLLRSLGQLDLMIATSYVILLTTVGGLMFWEGLRASGLADGIGDEVHRQRVLGCEPADFPGLRHRFDHG